MIRMLTITILLTALAVTVWGLIRSKRMRGIGFRDYVRSPRLRESISHEVARMEAAVIELSKQSGPDIVSAMLDDERYFLAENAVQVVGDRAVPALIAALSDPRFRRKCAFDDDGYAERVEPLETVLESLADFGASEAVPLIAHLVHDREATIRANAARVLGSSGVDSAVEPLMVSLADEDAHVRSVALMGIIDSIDKERASLVFSAGLYDAVELLVNGSGRMSAEEAAQCLFMLDRNRAVKRLAAPEQLVIGRTNLDAVLVAMHRHGVPVDESVLQRLAMELEPVADEYSNARALSAVLRLLASLGTESARRTIEQATGSSSREVRETAWEALADIQGIKEPHKMAYEQEDALGWEGLTEPQRVLIAVRQLIDQVNNGGFAQYFLSSSGDYWQHALSGLRTIGADRDVEILEQAIAKFGSAQPSTDSLVRHRQLSRIAGRKVDVFNVLESEFFADAQDREVLLMRYVIQHSTDFKRSASSPPRLP